jgi:hypothetical protein
VVKLCETHWQQLREAIDVAGLGILISDDDEASRRLESYQQLGEWTLDNYDPLLSAQVNIMLNLVRSLGTRLIDVQKADFSACLLCYANSEHAVGCDDPTCPSSPFDQYIDWAVRDEIEVWLELSTK